MAPAYIAAKGGIDALTYELAALYGPVGIRVVAVNPGAVDTDLGKDYSAADQSGFNQRLRDWSEQMIPLRRWATAEEIGRFIAMIASDDASYVSGTTLNIDGGWSHQFQPYSLKHEQHPDDFR
jgi:3-oxoacyl-[acyl-carrier protein] reductase